MSNTLLNRYNDTGFVRDEVELSSAELKTGYEGTGTYLVQVTVGIITSLVNLDVVEEVHGEGSSAEVVDKHFDLAEEGKEVYVAVGSAKFLSTFKSLQG